MDSELNRQHHLMRFRSAPSSLFADFSDEGCKDFFPRSSSPDPDTMFDRFISSACSPDLENIEDKPLANQRSSQFAEGGTVPHQNGFNSSASQMTFPPPAPLRNLSSRMENSYRLVNSMTVEQVQVKNAGSTGSNLIRHSSSPPGLFANLMDGYGVMRGVANYGSDSNGEAPTSGSRLKNQMNFSAAQNSAPTHLSRISEVGNDEEPSLGNGNDNNNSRCYISSFPISSWDDTPLVSENFSGIKRMRSDAKGTMLPGLSSSDTRNGEVENNPSALSHQFSLPNTSSEMAAVENFLQLHDSVPCKIRAKRGCATHPRSIAERVRRTKISERMRKLQELVPNMEKQTNTADMLDLAVDYIKDLQKEVKKLSDSRASCSCSSKQELSPTPTI